MSDRTVEFRQFVESKRPLVDPTLRKVTKQQKRTLADDEQERNVLSSKEYMVEAYALLKHITTLSRMLASIRKAYLNVDSKGILTSPHSEWRFDVGGSPEQWSTVRHLTNEERDQLDTQARVILSQCADKVKGMELIEKKRAELAASRSNPILRLLPSRLTRDSTSMSSDFVAAHHTGITWYLNRRLAEVSQSQTEMQEERVKRQMERAKTLGSGATKEAAALSLDNQDDGPQSDTKSNSWLDGPSGFASSLTFSLTGSSSTVASSQPFTRQTKQQQPLPEDIYGMSDDDGEELELTPSQIMQFETENANLLRSVQDTLASVQLAESRLLDISALQMELINHLTTQTEVTEQLHEDAIATSVMVEKGNVQLREARRRAKDGRMFILLFLLGASFALLFLHFY